VTATEVVGWANMLAAISGLDAGKVEQGQSPDDSKYRKEQIRSGKNAISYAA
jgi:hypothetical protein